MDSKFQLVLLVAVLALAKAQEPSGRPAQYSYSYDVKDPYTGDSKTQVESRSGDVVRGQYSLDDPDGTRRIVDYVSDPENGFRVSINKVPNGQLSIGPGGSYSPYVPPSPVVKASFPGSSGSNSVDGSSGGSSPSASSVSPASVSVTPASVSVSSPAPFPAPVVPPVVAPPVPAPVVSPYYAPYAYNRYSYPYRAYPYAQPYNYYPSIYPNAYYRFY